MKNKFFGFTLAEVLVTLGIIGIVASLTMPTLIANTRKNQVSARLKKFNSLMGQVMIDAEREKGMSEDWGQNAMTPRQYFAAYIQPYLKYTKVEDYNGSGQESTKVYLADGTSFWIFKGGCMDFKFDTNADKAPNVEGRDQFTFLQCQVKKDASWCDGATWCAYRLDNTTRAQRLQRCASSPIYCSGFLEGENWEFPHDYPHRI